MPRRGPVPCSHPGCARVVEYGTKYCEEHAPLHTCEDRGSAAARGYDRRWQKARKLYLQAHPLCVRCLEAGRYTKATVVDHIKPHRGDTKLFWDQDNWQALCKPCHDKKTWREDSNPEYTF